jgi:hypothetical protein
MGNQGILNSSFRVNSKVYVLYAVDLYYLLRFEDPNYDPKANGYNVATWTGCGDTTLLRN